MPPKAKFTREEIVSAALEVARSKGIDAVTAREVGNYLGTSSSPVFVAFKNMDELLNDVYNSAVKEYSDYIADSVNYTPAFKQFGFRLIEFASTQPNLFKMIYKYRQGEKSYSKMIMSIPAADFCVQTVMEQAQVNYENARLIFEEVLLAGLGICYMIADNKCTFTEQDLNKYLGIAYRGAVLTVTTLNEDEYAVHPSINN